MKNRRRKGIRAVILALATAAIVVPAASGYVYFPGGSDAKSPGYTPQALKAMNERWTKQAESYYQHAYTPQALQAMSERWTRLAGAYKHASNVEAVESGSTGGLYPGSGAGPGSTVTGSTRPDDRGGIRSIEPSTATSDYVDRQLANLVAKAALVAQALHVDDRAGIHGPGPVETPSVVSVRGDGFDWTDAGIGASVALLTAAMLAAATLMRRRAGLAV